MCLFSAIFIVQLFYTRLCSYSRVLDKYSTLTRLKVQARITILAQRILQGSKKCLATLGGGNPTRPMSGKSLRRKGCQSLESKDKIKQDQERERLLKNSFAPSFLYPYQSCAKTPFRLSTDDWLH